MSELYSPQQIADYLLSEKLAMHGISPDVYAQNEALFADLGRVAQLGSADLLAVQPIGSRSNGTSWLHSDLDTCVVRFDTEDGQKDCDRLVTAAEATGTETDAQLAVAYGNLCDRVPTSVDGLIETVRSNPASLATLFDEGIYAAPDLKLVQFAVVSLLRVPEITGRLPRANWWKIYDHHRTRYLGWLPSMRRNLKSRLSEDQHGAIEGVFTYDLMDDRAIAYGLSPDGLTEKYDELLLWTAQNERDLRGSRGWQLMTDVELVIAAER